jgi:2'-hydroxyisoflavone reductase
MVEDVTRDTYGPLKALCERAAEAAMPGRVLNVRAGLLVGPYDPTDRFTYWAARMARGGDLLAPPTPEAQVQFIDARDVAAWVMRMAAHRTAGVYNVTGPATRLTFAQFLEASQIATGSNATWHWSSADFLASRAVRPWIDLPLWVRDEIRGLLQVDITKAVQTGLTFRALTETITDTLAWAGARPDTYVWQAGLTPQRETELLTLMHVIPCAYADNPL